MTEVLCTAYRLMNGTNRWDPQIFQIRNYIDCKICEYKDTHPNDGEVMIIGHIRSLNLLIPRVNLFIE